METLKIDILNEQEKKVLVEFLDSKNYHYRSDTDDYTLSEEEVAIMVKRKNDFLSGKMSARPWSEIKQQYDSV